MKTIKITILCLFLGIVHPTSFAIKPDRTYRFYPEKLGLIYRDLDVKTSDSLKIKTWFFPAQPAPTDEELDAAWDNPLKKTYQTIDNKRRPTIIFANSDAGKRTIPTQTNS
jgi:catechol 2,3-dioxygenase-like lactoylglutathione lyase family enzyme